MGTDHSMHGGIAPDLTDVAILRQHPLLATATAKLVWAEKHLAALEHNVGEAFVDPANQAVLRAELDVQSGYHVFRIQSLPEVTLAWTEHFMHAVADVATNLRSALDKFAWRDACAYAGGTPSDVPGVKFPICDTTEDWIKAGRARKQLEPTHCGLVEQFQPYKGVNGRADDWTGPYVHPLTLLRNLANDDKHRDTEPVLLVSTRFQLRAFEVSQREEVFANGSIQVPDWDFPGLHKAMELNLEVIRARLSSDTEPEVEEAGLAIPQVAISEGRLAVPTLKRLHRFVHLFLSEFARKFPTA